MNDAEIKPVWERTPEARYRTDNKYRQLTDMLEAYMHNAEFTPSEMRECSLLAAIHFEQRQLKHVHGYTMSTPTAHQVWTRVEEIYKALQNDERPFMGPPR